jgi:ABC-type antimicrobial peptide transport system permease subunit
MNSTMWKIALRTLARHKTYALLNVAGLALAGLLIAYVTVALQSLKAARAHPVRALRYE